MSNLKSVDDILQKVDQLPAMSKAVIEIIRCIEDEEISIDMLTQLVSSDIGLATSMLKSANTMRFSMHGGIASVHDAVMLIGFKQIRDMVCMIGVMNSFQQDKASFFDYAAFWRRSMGVGVCARILARQAKLNPETAFITGMLHEIGQLALVVAAPNEFRFAIDFSASHDCSILEAEKTVLEMDHALIGGHLGRKWELPKVICDAISMHHSPDVAPIAPMTDLIHVSTVLSHALELGADERIMPILSDLAMARLDINLFQLKPCFAQIECEYLHVVSILD